MVRVGLVGCGRISHNHFTAIAQQSGIEVVACCDILPERAKAAAEHYRVPFWTTEYTELLARPEVDLVAICTPSGLHPKQGIQAAEAAKQVLTEKPMGVRLPEADQLIAACAQEKVQLFVVLQNRLNPAIQQLRQALDTGRFGQLYFIQANVFWTRPQDYYDQAPWRGTWQWDGGAFMNQASHYVDMVQWLGGPIVEVQAIRATLARDIETEDTGAAIIRFQRGTLASINVTMLTYPQNLEGSITVLGEKGTVRIGGMAMNTIEEWKFADQQAGDQVIAQLATEIESVYGFGHVGYYQNVREVLEEGKSPLCDGQEGRKSLALLTDIYQQSR